MKHPGVASDKPNFITGFRNSKSNLAKKTWQFRTVPV